MKTIGEKLRDARTAKNLKQSEVAAQIGCAATSLTNWENGRVNPSLDVLSKLCAIYGIEPLSLPDRVYSFTDLVGISRKPVSDRSYEETIALNFSEPVLSRLLTVEAARVSTEKTNETHAFLKDTLLLDRLGGTASQNEIDAVHEEYKTNGEADSDILFAFHMLSMQNKTAFLAMLSGLVMADDCLQPFADRVGTLYGNGIRMDTVNAEGADISDTQDAPDTQEDMDTTFVEKIEKAKVFTLKNLTDERKRLIDGTPL